MDRIYKYKLLGIHLIPIVLIMFDVLRGFVTDGVGMVETSLLLTYTMFFIVFKKGILSFNYLLTIFFVYTLLLGLYSSNTVKTFQNYSWVLISFYMAPIAFYTIRDLKAFEYLNKSMVWLAIIFVANGLICAALGIGTNIYGGEFKMGAFTLATLYSGSIYLMLLPLILPNLKTQKTFRIICLATSGVLFILLVLSLRRTAILIPIIGYAVYFIYTKHKLELLKSVLIAVAILLISFPLYKTTLLDSVANREHAFKSDYEITEEYRYLETIIVFNERLDNSVSWHKTLFGKEVFNSYGNYNHGDWGLRPLHIDFNKLIHGTGIIGFFLYLGVFIYFYYLFLKLKKNVPHNDYYNEMAAVFRALFIVIFLISTQGGMYVITFRALIFIYMGAILGVFSEAGKNKQLNY